MAISVKEAIVDARNWISFQLAIIAPPLSVTGSDIAPSARMLTKGGNGSDTPLQKLLADFTRTASSQDAAEEAD